MTHAHQGVMVGHSDRGLGFGPNAPRATGIARTTSGARLQTTMHQAPMPWPMKSWRPPQRA